MFILKSSLSGQHRSNITTLYQRACCNLATLLRIPVSYCCNPGGQQVMAQTHGLLVSLWETQLEMWAPCSRLGQLWLMQEFREWVSG